MTEQPDPEPSIESPSAHSPWDSVAPASPGAMERRSAEERKQLLAQQVQMASVRGRRVESSQDFQAVLIEGKPINHTLHAILTIFTCLVWGLVWIVIAATGGEKRELVVIDEWGNVQYQKLGKA